MSNFLPVLCGKHSSRFVFSLGSVCGFLLLSSKAGTVATVCTLRGEDFLEGGAACLLFLHDKKKNAEETEAEERKQEKDVELANVRWRMRSNSSSSNSSNNSNNNSSSNNNSFHLILYSLHAGILNQVMENWFTLVPSFCAGAFLPPPSLVFSHLGCGDASGGKKDPKRWGGKRRRKSVRDLNAFSIQATKESQSSRRNIN